MIDGETVGGIAKEDEVSRVIEHRVGVEHAIHIDHPRQVAHIVGHRLVDAADERAERLGLADHQVGLAALGHCGETGLQTLAYRPQRDDGRHADRDTHQSEDCASLATKKIF